LNIQWIGELAALATSLCFTTGSVLFTLASRKVGAVILNRTRLLAALFFLVGAHWLLIGTPWPTQAGRMEWLWLGLSGAIGLALGDLFLFKGYTLVGPRLTMLMMSLSPILTTLLAWIFLDETLTFLQILGISITLGGVAWVVLEKNHQTPSHALKIRSGLLVGMAAAACQSVGLVLARQGLGQSFHPLSGNFIRMFSAAAFIWFITLMQGQSGATLKKLQQNPQALRFALLGAFVAPFLGVSLSLVAIQNAEVGVASTLMALPPVFLLPISLVVFHEKFGWQAVAGTLLAVAGSAVLFLV
jgi:drug/metabolite transporter (DMT)-like permease